MTERQLLADEITDAANKIKHTRITDLPGFEVACPACDHKLIDDPNELSYEELEKMMTWTLAQLTAWNRLQENSGISRSEMLHFTTAAGTERPGIGGALAGSGGLVAVTNFHGMFVGIEPDGYTHS